MDKPAAAPSEPDKFIFRATVRPFAYMLMLFTFSLLVFVVLFLSENLNWVGWVLMGLFFLALVAAITTFKTIQLTDKQLNIKYVIHPKTTSYTYAQIQQYAAYQTTESFTKMLVVKFIIEQKPIVFTSFLYGKKNIDKLNQLITRKLATNQYVQ